MKDSIVNLVEIDPVSINVDFVKHIVKIYNKGD